MTFTPALRRDLLPPALWSIDSKQAGTPPAVWPPRELHVRVRSTPSASVTRAGLSPSLSGAAGNHWSEETLHSLTPVAGSALSFGALPSAGLWSETKASSIKTDLPRHTLRDGFSFLLLVLKAGKGLTPLKIMEPNQHKSKENQTVAPRNTYSYYFLGDFFSANT